ncbi:hypothetical protein Hanom_Chr05g00454671 [Helianthus anomalus]
METCIVIMKLLLFFASLVLKVFDMLSDCKFFMWKQNFDKFFEPHSNCSSGPVSYQELKTGGICGKI